MATDIICVRDSNEDGSVADPNVFAIVDVLFSGGSKDTRPSWGVSGLASGSDTTRFREAPVPSGVIVVPGNGGGGKTDQHHPYERDDNERDECNYIMSDGRQCDRPRADPRHVVAPELPLCDTKYPEGASGKCDICGHPKSEHAKEATEPGNMTKTESLLTDIRDVLREIRDQRAPVTLSGPKPRERSAAFGVAVSKLRKLPEGFDRDK